MHRTQALTAGSADDADQGYVFYGREARLSVLVDAFLASALYSIFFK